MGQVLLVEDDEDVRQMLRLMLERAGHSVVEARDGLIALEHVRLGDVPDLVVSDLRMPGVDGIELLHALRDLPACASLPFMLITGVAVDGRIKGLQTMLRTGVLAKPITAVDLRTAVAELLEGDS